MKEIKLNDDKTLDILDPTKYYVAKIDWINDHIDYWELVCFHNNTDNYYGFCFLINHRNFEPRTLKIIWESDNLQYSCQSCLDSMCSEPALATYIGNLYQFENKEQFITYVKNGLL